MKLPDVKAAVSRLKGIVMETPLIKSRFHPNLYFKCENFQHAGCFKLRGAYNKISQLGRNVKGVVTYSAGNHAQGVALSARWLGLKAIVVMPKNALRNKLSAVKRLGARVLIWGETSEDIKIMSESLASGNGFTMIPPFDDPDIIAGQGTIASEIIKEIPGVKNIVVPIGGGGLIAGILSALRGKRSVRVIGVEPLGISKTSKSVKAGKPVTISAGGTIADGLRVMRLGDLTFKIIKKYVDDIVTVSETEIISSVRYLIFKENLVVEPSGAVSVAAVMFDKIKNLKGKTVAIVSGGNVDFKSISFGWEMS